jgi:signal transduction histidine kinase
MTITTTLLTGVVLGWLLLALTFSLYRWARRWWRRRRYGEPIDHTALVMKYGRRMAAASDREALARILTDELPRALRSERAALLLLAGHHLVAFETEDIRLPVSHAAVRWVASAGEAHTANRGWLNELIQQDRGGLAWTRVWVPLMRGTHLQGMWLLGARVGELKYAPQDLQWLTTVGRQAAVMLETMRYTEQEREAASEMRALYRQVVAAREGERERLARELHDGVLQDVCAVTRDLKALEAQPETDSTDSRQVGSVPPATLATRSGEAVQALRAICSDLRPPLLQRDLTSALKALVGELDARSPAPVHIDVTTDDLHLPDDVALAVFRITQEALHNAMQHAEASEIAVRLTRYPDRLRLTVTDDGRGIAGGVDRSRFVAQGHFGLAGMRERAAMIGGRLDIQTAADYGTAVILELPL